MMAPETLLDPDMPRLWTIPAGVPFLKALAQGLAAASDLARHPDALQDAVIYVPNRRSARTLALELLHAAGEGAALLPPDIRALGDLETDEAPHGAEEAIAGLGPALAEAKRTGTLMRFVLSFYERTGDTIPLPGALAAANALGALLDQAALAGLEDWSALADLAT
ncbi:MAG: double-strand break repair protein AddB, partial [Pseudomonadota bacterium]